MTENELVYLAWLHNSLRQLRIEIFEENKRFQHQLVDLREKFEAELKYFGNSHVETMAAKTSRFKVLVNQLENFSSRSWERNLSVPPQLPSLDSLGEEAIEV